MDSTINAIKANKAKAALRRRRTSQFNNLMHALEACAALFILLSWISGGGGGGSLSLAVDSAAHHSLRLFRNPLSVSLLCNAIIAAVALLSATGDRKQRTTKPADFSDKIYEEYLSRRKITQSAGFQIPAAENPTEEESSAEKLLVPYSAEPKPIIKHEVSQEAPISAVIAAAGEGEIRRYRRTRSAVAVRMSRRGENRTLKRSMTEKGQLPAEADLRRSVDDLSNEEFNRTVESYIERTKSLLQKELMADLAAAVPRESRGESNQMALIMIRD